MREFMLILHFIGLAMGLGTSFAFMFLGIASAKLEKSEALKFTIHSFAISRMGHIGLALLIISGLYLMTPYWGNLADMPLLIGKLVLVVVLAVMIGFITKISNQAKSGDTEQHLKRIETFGKVSLITSLAIVILAVLVFH